MFFLHILHVKFFILISYCSSILYTHLRGTVRLTFLRQLTDHSSLLAPINGIMYLFSAVPKTPYLDLKLFPELQLLKDNWLIIKAEAKVLYENGAISASEKHDDIGFNSFFRRGWKRFYLKWYQDPLPSAQALCPKTLKLIQQIPCINAAMFTLLPKKSFLFKHRDPYAGSLRYHLGLITPNSSACSIYVDGQPYFWQDGQDVMFDETYIHYAENNTTKDRIILFCDIQRPLKSKIAALINTLFSQTIMKAASSKNVPTESVGIINKLFTYAYAIRIFSKRIKNYNRTLYAALKYTVYLTAFYYFFLK